MAAVPHRAPVRQPLLAVDPPRAAVDPQDGPVLPDHISCVLQARSVVVAPLRCAAGRAIPAAGAHSLDDPAASLGDTEAILAAG